MSQGRPTIPADLRRKVLIEAGHRCAIPTCRYIDVDVHHIVPWENCKKHEYQNLIALCPNCHRRAGKGEIDRKALRIYKANLRYTHDKFSQFEVDILFELYNAQPEKDFLWPSYLMLLIKRLLDSNYVDRAEGLPRKDGVSVFFVSDMPANPDNLKITKEGKEFVESLEIEHHHW